MVFPTNFFTRVLSKRPPTTHDGETKPPAPRNNVLVGPSASDQAPVEPSIDYVLVGSSTVSAGVEPSENATSVGPSVWNPVSVGPFGGPGGSAFDDGIYNGIKQVILTNGLVIDSIEIEYDQNGLSERFRHGGDTKSINKISKIELEYPDEFLISFWGYTGIIFENGIPYVRSLTFQSNRRTYGPFGVENGKYFSFPSTGGKIIGFHGRSGIFIDSIGAYLEPLHH